MSSHLKNKFLKSDFSPQISSKPQVLKRRSIEKKRANVLKKEKKRKKKKS
jgi:hypothetical protein